MSAFFDMITKEEIEREKLATEERNIRLTSMVATKLRLESAILLAAGYPDNGRMKEASMLLAAARRSNAPEIR